MADQSIILKFGGAALASPDHIREVATLIAEKAASGDRIVVVVSAMRGMTDELTQLAHQISPCPPKREQDMLISVGERISMSLLAIALGEEAISLTGSQSGIITCESHTEALIVDVRPARILSALSQGKTVIVAGFQGVSREKEITTIGRGGSDTTAVALGVALRASHIEFYKDVNGVYSADPKHDPEATLRSALSFDEALHLGAIHPRAISLASKNRLPLHVISMSKEDRSTCPGTVIGEGGEQGEPIYERAEEDVPLSRHL